MATAFMKFKAIIRENGNSTTVSVDDDLDLKRATRAVKSLPDDLNINGFCDLKGCRAITILPANMSVTSYLDLEDCSSLKFISAGLSVGNDIDFSGCTSLHMIPASVDLAGTVYLRDNQRMLCFSADIAAKHENLVDLSGIDQNLQQYLEASSEACGALLNNAALLKRVQDGQIHRDAELSEVLRKEREQQKVAPKKQNMKPRRTRRPRR